MLKLQPKEPKECCKSHSRNKHNVGMGLSRSDNQSQFQIQIVRSLDAKLILKNPTNDESKHLITPKETNASILKQVILSTFQMWCTAFHSTPKT